MSIANEIERLTSAKAAIKTSINAKNKNTNQITDEKLDEYSAYIDLIQTGDPDYPEDWVQMDSAANMTVEEIQCIVRSDMPCNLLFMGLPSTTQREVEVTVLGESDTTKSFKVYNRSPSSDTLIGTYYFGETFTLNKSLTVTADGRYCYYFEFDEDNGKMCSQGYRTLLLKIRVNKNKHPEGTISRFQPGTMSENVPNVLAVRVKSSGAINFALGAMNYLKPIFTEYVDLSSAQSVKINNTETFNGCKRLKKVELPINFEIKAHEFKNCIALKNITNLNSVTFPNPTISGAYPSPFYNLPALAFNADIFDGIAYTADNLLEHLENMYGTLTISGSRCPIISHCGCNHIVIENTVTVFHGGDLGSYSDITDIEFPSTTCTFETGQLTITHCPNLKSLTNLENFHTIGFYINIDFSDCPKLEEVDLTNVVHKNIKISGNYHSRGSLTSLTLGDTKTFSTEAPQIDVSYQALDREALVSIFNQLPSYSSVNMSIKITGCSGRSDLTDSDKEIATSKGWTIIS